MALQNVSLSLTAGEVHALVGENGAGKSTLIHVIAGLLSPDSGQICFRGQTVAWTNPVAARQRGIVAVHQEAELFPTLSVAENMALEQGLPCGPAGWIHWRDPLARRCAVALLNEPLDIRQQAGNLSVGQRHMTQIAAAVSHGAEVLVLDEPTSALTAGESDWLFRQIERLKASGVAILYISHRQDEIFRLADRITILRDGRRVWTGPTDTIDRAELIRQMVGRQRAELITQARHPRVGRTDATRLKVERLTAGDGRFADISLAARGGEVLGIYGLVGAGRSELRKPCLVCGQAARELSRSTTGNNSLIAPCKPPAPDWRTSPKIVFGRAYSTAFRFAPTLCSAPGQTELGISGARQPRASRDAPASRGIGDQVSRRRTTDRPTFRRQPAKSGLARWLLTRPKVLILDEPTRGVDVTGKAEIHRIVRRLADEGAAVMMISSDLSEAMEHSDRLIVFRAGRIAGEFLPAETTPEAIAAVALPLDEAIPVQRGPTSRRAHPHERNRVVRLGRGIIARLSPFHGYFPERRQSARVAGQRLGAVHSFAGRRRRDPWRRHRYLARLVAGLIGRSRRIGAQASLSHGRDHTGRHRRHAWPSARWAAS